MTGTALAALAAAAVAQAMWIQQHRDYRFDGPLPRIEVLQERSWTSRLAAANPGHDPRSLRGMYFPGLILLRAAPLPEMLPILLHELVHHAQEQAGERQACDSEIIAYSLQAEWQVRTDHYGLTVDFPAAEAHARACKAGPSVRVGRPSDESDGR